MQTKNTILRLASEIFPEIRDIRRQIHRNPELSFNEFQTAALIHSALSNWNILHQTNIAGTGVVALIKGKNPEKYCVALRADMDALPIQEQGDCDYRSQNSGVMHACGHDAHTAMLLGVAKILNDLRDTLEGSVKLIFQPAEEKLPGGAKAMIDSGILDGVNVAIAQHVYPDLPAASVGFHPGNYMASSDEVNITLKGKGGHAAKPSERNNTVAAASCLVLALSDLSDEFKISDNHDDKTILAFGSLIADGTYNVIPDIVTMKGTLRTFNETHRDAMKHKINEITKKVADNFGIRADVRIDSGYPALNNDVHLTNMLKSAAEMYLGKEKVVDIPQLMTSEDFAAFTQRVPSCFYRLGVANINKGINSNQHTATFNIDEDAMITGVGLMSWLAISSLNDINK